MCAEKWRKAMIYYYYYYYSFRWIINLKKNLAFNEHDGWMNEWMNHYATCVDLAELKFDPWRSEAEYSTSGHRGSPQ